MKVIGITGGIGAGKTYVSQLMQEHYGLSTYNCDNEAKRLTNESAQIKKQLISLLGAEVFTIDGLLNKPLLAQYLFKNKQNAENVNAIIHPVVKQDFLRWKEENAKSTTLLLESAILLESGFDCLCDEIIVVTAPTDVRIERACLRDGSSPEAIRQRIDAQLSDKDRLDMARKTTLTHIIKNDGSPLLPQIEEILTKI